jgi:uncharacterized protein YjiS (DUF1127 family)
MSCGSTACTQYDTPASTPFAGLTWLWQGPSVWLAKISRGRKRSHQRRQLLELDDRLLADIGPSREQAVEEAGKSFWIRVTMWRVYR